MLDEKNTHIAVEPEKDQIELYFDTKGSELDIHSKVATDPTAGLGVEGKENRSLTRDDFPPFAMLPYDGEGWTLTWEGGPSPHPIAEAMAYCAEKLIGREERIAGITNPGKWLRLALDAICLTGADSLNNTRSLHYRIYGSDLLAINMRSLPKNTCSLMATACLFPLVFTYTMLKNTVGAAICLTLSMFHAVEGMIRKFACLLSAGSKPQEEVVEWSQEQYFLDGETGFHCP
jgi:hypothetical protein